MSWKYLVAKVLNKIDSLVLTINCFSKNYINLYKRIFVVYWLDIYVELSEKYQQSVKKYTK